MGDVNYIFFKKGNVSFGYIKSTRVKKKLSLRLYTHIHHSGSMGYYSRLVYSQI